MNRLISAMVLAPLFTLACSSGGGDTPAPAPTTEGSISRTIVRLHPDGTHEVRIVEVSAEQERAELGARGVRPEITFDGSCAGADLWVFDESTSCTGTVIPPGPDSGVGSVHGNELCVFGKGTVSLAEIGWASAVKSYWPGNEPGYFTTMAATNAGPQPVSEEFQAWQACTVAGVFAEFAQTVTLTN